MDEKDDLLDLRNLGIQEMKKLTLSCVLLHLLLIQDVTWYAKMSLTWM